MEKKRKMEKGKGEGLVAQACSASRPASAQQPSQPNHTRIRPARARGPACGPASPARPPASLAVAATLAPRVSRTLPMPVRLPVSACSRCLLDPARQRYCASSPRRAQTTVRQSSDSNGRGGQGSCPGHGPVSPLRRAHATPHTPLDASSRPDRP